MINKSYKVALFVYYDTQNSYELCAFITLLFRILTFFFYCHISKTRLFTHDQAVMYPKCELLHITTGVKVYPYEWLLE